MDLYCGLLGVAAIDHIMIDVLISHINESVSSLQTRSELTICYDSIGPFRSVSVFPLSVRA